LRFDFFKKRSVRLPLSQSNYGANTAQGRHFMLDIFKKQVVMMTVPLCWTAQVILLDADSVIEKATVSSGVDIKKNINLKKQPVVSICNLATPPVAIGYNWGGCRRQEICPAPGGRVEDGFGRTFAVPASVLRRGPPVPTIPLARRHPVGCFKVLHSCCATLFNPVF